MRTRTPVELAESPPIWINEPSLRESAVTLAMASRSARGEALILGRLHD
jgi:hypothetical protein